MAKKFGSHWPYGFVVALALACVACPGQAQERSAISLTVGTNSQPIQLDRPYKTIKIDDPEVVDVIPKTDHSFLLRPLQSGSTQVLVLDDEDKTITKFPVLISSYVKIFNKKSLHGYERFRCGPDGCNFDTVSK